VAVVGALATTTGTASAQSSDVRAKAADVNSKIDCSNESEVLAAINAIKEKRGEVASDNTNIESNNSTIRLLEGTLAKLQSEALEIEGEILGASNAYIEAKEEEIEALEKGIVMLEEELEAHTRQRNENIKEKEKEAAALLPLLGENREENEPIERLIGKLLREADREAILQNREAARLREEIEPLQRAIEKLLGQIDRDITAQARQIKALLHEQLPSAERSILGAIKSLQQGIQLLQRRIKAIEKEEIEPLVNAVARCHSILVLKASGKALEVGAEIRGESSNLVFSSETGNVECSTNTASGPLKVNRASIDESEITEGFFRGTEMEPEQLCRSTIGFGPAHVAAADLPWKVKFYAKGCPSHCRTEFIGTPVVAFTIAFPDHPGGLTCIFDAATIHDSWNMTTDVDTIANQKVKLDTEESDRLCPKSLVLNGSSRLFSGEEQLEGELL
jgi:hypothetical protein